MTDNKTLIAEAQAAMAGGDGSRFAALLDDKVVWRTMGRGRWDLRFEGRESLTNDLFRKLYAQFEGKLINRAASIFGDGDHVIVESEGEGVTKAGVRYDNRYAIFYRFEGGKIVEIHEYLDTALADQALDFVF